MAKVSRERPSRLVIRSKRRKIVLSKSKRAESNGALTLPSHANEPPSRLEDSIIFFHGEKSIGKTSLAAEFKDALVFMFERARRNLKIFQVPERDPKTGKTPPMTWEMFAEFVELFVESDYQTGVIDTIDGAYMACYNHVLKEHNVASPDESQSGYAIWDEIAAEFGGMIHLLQQSGKGLILISHSKPRPLMRAANKKRKGLQRDELDESIQTYDRMEPTCKPAAFRLAQEMADFVFYYGYRDGYRAITVRSPHNIYWTAVGMDDHFLDPDGTPIECFKVGQSSQMAFKNLQDAYNNKLRDIDYTPPARTSGRVLRRGRAKR